ncbi:MAG TPA: indolepyruvate ferredoxin oxidoreductase subunit alpha [Syntrophales bacterium]|nr:indolepyruvate ferredoxin oxidoreductase subunit alpha [Syntrophobacterales bacterium]HQL90383.1 indolepyruvate ferredoxin oxidoreductase subunit alpha [Syntrophales bacterium]
MLELMSGNEAIARGAWECGATFGAGYPGTPSTEILEAFAQYKGVYAEWSPNEKVGLEVAIGAAFAGARAMAVMKHVGVNVAADPLFTVSYTGTNGALVIITADDPSLHSSQNEQDNRNYAKFAKIPMLEPADSQEAKDFIKLAFELSERFDTPVFLRTTTRVSHSKSVVRTEEQSAVGDRTDIRHLPLKYVMVPVNARARRVEVEKRMQALREWAETFPGNRVEMGSPEVGIITAGMPYNYAKDAFPEYSYLKLGLVHPLPEKMIRDFASRVKTLYVVEELDPFIEEQVRAMGIAVSGKAVFPYTNEFDPGVIEQGVTGRSSAAAVTLQTIPPRPPNLCPGCPHRALFYALGKTKAFVSGDIGCYTLSYMKPLSAMDSCICMGASIGIAHGMSKALGPKGKGKVVGVIGDSTFIHSGITTLLNTAYNRSDAVFIIADNRTTAMTGMQEHPATGYTLQGEKTRELDFAALGKVLGIDSVEVIDPLDYKNTTDVLKRELAKDGPSLIISRSPCVLLMSKKADRAKPFFTDPDLCIGCKVCLSCGCPAISWKDFEKSGMPPRPERKKQKGIAVIDADLCTGCSLCAQLCRQEAIMREGA